MMKLLENFFYSLGAYVRMVIEVMLSVVTAPPKWRLIRDALFEMGVRSLPVVVITGLSTGMVLAAQSIFQLSDKGLAESTGFMVTKSMLVELGPVLTAFMITGRVGAAITAEIGTMKVTEQIDALTSMAVSPTYFLLSPRFIAMLIMVPMLTLFSALCGVVGSFCIADFYGMSAYTFFSPIPQYVNGYDIFSGMIKASCFGFLIVTIASFQGLLTRGGAQGVGRSTTSSVVTCYSAILIANFILTVSLNAIYWYVYK